MSMATTYRKLPTYYDRLLPLSSRGERDAMRQTEKSIYLHFYRTYGQ